MNLKNIPATDVLYMVEMVAREKNLDVEKLLNGLEEAIKLTAIQQYGNRSNLKVSLNRKTGHINLYRLLEVVSNTIQEFDHHTMIKFNAAKEIVNNPKVGDILEEELPPLDINRLSAQTARIFISEKIKEIESNKNYETLQKMVGEIVEGVVKAIEKRNVIISLEGVEAVLKPNNMLPNDIFKVKDKVKAYLSKVEKLQYGVLPHISRTSPEFLAKLLEKEIPEIQEGRVEIKGIVRDGGRSKVSVYAYDQSLDCVAACIGIKGNRIRAVSNQLLGEKIDIIRWSGDIEQYVINSFAPIQIYKITIDKDNRQINIVINDKDKKLAIGRDGQNIRQISNLIGMNIFIDANNKNLAHQTENIINELVENLDIDELLASLLISEGFTSISAIANAELHQITNIDELDENIAEELINRAKESLAYMNINKPIVEETIAYDFTPDELIKEIGHVMRVNGIDSPQKIAELSSDELDDMLKEHKINISKNKIDEVILKLRKKLFFNVKKED